MAWDSLGVINLSSSWKLFNVPVIERTLFRITQSAAGLSSGVAWLSFYYSNGGRYGYRKFFLTSDPILVIMPIPQALLDRNLLVRYAAMKIGRGTVFDSINVGSGFTSWIAQLEVSDI